ncbi:MAG: response regulator transcription factor [Bacteroidota bacterium]|jgi:two-component system alkaline phosphatase synthesis response regulator PhoP
MKKNYRILIVEDEADIAELLKLNLELEGYRITIAPHGAVAINLLKTESFDLIIMDIMMPSMDGLTATHHIRLSSNNVPILILSAGSTPQDRINGLRSGADDYMSKPFEIEELILRVEKILMRAHREDPVINYMEYEFGGNYVNFNSYEARGINGDFKLTKKEAQLLRLLIEKKNFVVSREEILKTVWGYTVFPSTRTIDNFILAFRKYFEKDIKNPRYFLSHRGLGYKFSENGE